MANNANSNQNVTKANLNHHANDQNSGNNNENNNSSQQSMSTVMLSQVSTNSNRGRQNGN